MNVADKQILVVGLGLSGDAAARLLVSQGACVTVLDTREDDAVAHKADSLSELGVQVVLGSNEVPERDFEFAVVSPGIGPKSAVYKNLQRRELRIIGELELGARFCECLQIGITGTNGKTTTTELLNHMLNQSGCPSAVAGNIGMPISCRADLSGSLDFLAVEVSSFQLETIECFRPAISILTNLSVDHLDRYESVEAYARAKGRIFENQREFDWAVLQTEALAYLRALGIEIHARTITFSAGNRTADFHMEGDMICSTLPGWEGPLLAMQQTRLRGPHNAENMMAAMSAGRILQMPLESIVRTLKSFEPSPHRCEFVDEINGVQFINDSKATNLDAMMKAVGGIPSVRTNEPNVWLIAGGSDKGFEFADAGPLLAGRVKGVFLIGETRERMREAWSLFASCQIVEDLADAVNSAAERAELGDVVLMSPACASFDQFSGYAARGNRFKEIVAELSSTRYSGNPCSETPTNGGCVVESHTEN